jgi:hypothetical protein
VAWWLKSHWLPTSLAVLRNGASPRRLRSAEDVVENFAGEIVDQSVSYMAAAVLPDAHDEKSRTAIIDFARPRGGPLWIATST